MGACLALSHHPFQLTRSFCAFSRTFFGSVAGPAAKLYTTESSETEAVLEDDGMVAVHTVLSRAAPFFAPDASLAALDLIFSPEKEERRLRVRDFVFLAAMVE